MLTTVQLIWIPAVLQTSGAQHLLYMPNCSPKYPTGQVGLHSTDLFIYRTVILRGKNITTCAK